MATIFEDLCSAVDESQLKHAADQKEKNITFIIQSGDEQVKFLYSVDEEKRLIYVISLIAEMIHEDNDFHAAYKFCNKWNSSFKYPKARVDEIHRIMICEWTWNMDASYSGEFLKQIVLDSFISLSRFFFADAVKSGMYR